MFAVPRGWNAAGPGRWIGGQVTRPGAARPHGPPRAHGGLPGGTPSRGLAGWVLLPTPARGGTPASGARSPRTGGLRGRGPGPAPAGKGGLAGRAALRRGQTLPPPLPAPSGTAVRAAPGRRGAGTAPRARGEGPRVLGELVNPGPPRLWVQGVTLPGTPLAHTPPPAAPSSCRWPCLPSGHRQLGRDRLPVPAPGVHRAAVQPEGWGGILAPGSCQLCPQPGTTQPARPRAGDPHAPAPGGLGPPHARYRPAPHRSATVRTPPVPGLWPLLPCRAGLGGPRRGQGTCPHAGAGE